MAPEADRVAILEADRVAILEANRVAILDPTRAATPDPTQAAADLDPILGEGLDQGAAVPVLVLVLVPGQWRSRR